MDDDLEIDLTSDPPRALHTDRVSDDEVEGACPHGLRPDFEAAETMPDGRRSVPLVPDVDPDFVN